MESPIQQGTEITRTIIPIRIFLSFDLPIHLCDKSQPIDAPGPALCERLALFLGTEGDGLSKETISLCDFTLKIPMSHGIDSLNVAAAAAVAFFATAKKN